MKNIIFYLLIFLTITSCSYNPTVCDCVDEQIEHLNTSIESDFKIDVKDLTSKECFELFKSNHIEEDIKYCDKFTELERVSQSMIDAVFEKSLNDPDFGGNTEEELMREFEQNEDFKKAMEELENLGK